MKRKKRILKGLTLAFAAAAIAAPAAGARVNSERSYVSSYTSSSQHARNAQNQIGSNATGYTPQQLRALELRSEGMNQRYIQVAQNRPDDRAGLRGPATESVVPDVFARELTKSASDAATIRHADDRAGVRGPGFVRTPVLVSAPGSGFDWGDASIGAGTALASAIVLLGSVALTRRSRERELAV